MRRLQRWIPLSRYARVLAAFTARQPVVDVTVCFASQIIKAWLQRSPAVALFNR